MPIHKDKTLIEVLMSNSKMLPNGCVEWRGHSIQFGYGQIRWLGRYQLFHRLAYEEYNDYSLRDGQVVRHMCDNPKCINPGHLVVGSQLDNMRDKYIKKVLTPEGGFIIV